MGASGTGKTVLATHFVDAGVAAGETALYVTLEEAGDALRAKWDAFDLSLGEGLRDGRLEVLQAPITELDIDWLAHTVRAAMDRLQPSRIVFDSLNELQTGAEREHRHPGYLWALANMARSDGASVVFTQEIPIVDALTASDGVSNLFSNVLLLRYIEDDHALGRALTVLKMRDSLHSHGLVRLAIDERGMRGVGEVRGIESGLLGWSALRTE
jgi:circadian clock protein KaiC